MHELRQYLEDTSGSNGIPTVALVHFTEYSISNVRSKINKILKACGSSSFIEQIYQKRVLIKPNFCRIGQPGITTSPNVIDAMLSLLRDHSCNIVFGDGMTQSFLSQERFIEVKTKLGDIIKRHGVDFKHFDEPRSERTGFTSDGYTFYFPNWLKDIDIIINLAALKTHPQMVGTYAVKNLMGLLSGEDRLSLHTTGIAEGIWHMQSCLAKAVPKQIHIVDGLFSFQGYDASPNYVEPGVLIAGLNPCAVDFVCAKIMGIDPEKQFPQYAIALDNDFAYGQEKPINIVGTAIEKVTFQCHIPSQITEPPKAFPSINIHWGEFGYPLNQSLKDLFRQMNSDLPIDIYIGGAVPKKNTAGRLALCIGNASVIQNNNKNSSIFNIPGDPPAGTVFQSVVEQMKRYYQDQFKSQNT